MPRALRLLDRVIQHLRQRFRREPWWAELWAAVAAILWGLWVLVAGSDLSHADAYRIILGFAGEPVWIATALTLGALHIVTVLSDRIGARRLICGVAAWWWSVLLISMFLVVPRNQGLALYLVMAGINMVSMVRLPRMQG
jgi:hypothetical protein